MTLKQRPSCLVKRLAWIVHDHQANLDRATNSAWSGATVILKQNSTGPKTVHGSGHP
jgi:hypothetical protein